MEASNVRAMYDALVKVKRLFDGQIMFQPSIREAHKAVNAALAAPPRNCDVGTVEEQLDRYGLFCQNKCPICENRHSCHICGERYRMKCMVAWAQLPYDEGDTK